MSEIIRGTLIIHAAGGAGTNICHKDKKNPNGVTALEELKKFDDTLCEHRFHYIDTTDKTVKDFVNEIDFFRVTGDSHDGKVIDGSGGERGTNMDAISKSVARYLDERGYKSQKTGEYHLVVFSASGGSGSITAAVIIRSLLARDIPVIAVVIGDNTTGLYSQNTINTLATLSNIAKNPKINKPLSVIYLNNKDFGKVAFQAISNANKAIMDAVTMLSFFLSGRNSDLDHTDMLNIIDQSRQRSLAPYVTGEKAGLYQLMFFTGDVSLPDSGIAYSARSLTDERTSPDIPNVEIFHAKHGIVNDEDLLEIFGQQFPLHMLSVANYLDAEEKTLHTTTENFHSAASRKEHSTIQQSKYGTKSAEDDFVL